jgi:hypothetical protein
MHVLVQRIGRTIAGDEEILLAFAEAFDNVHSIRDWLKQKGISFAESFDAWA